MGCYGIGVSRILATSIETSHDKSGIRWPDSIAPYRAIIVPIGDAAESNAMLAKAESLYSLITNEVRAFCSTNAVVSSFSLNKRKFCFSAKSRFRL